LKVVKKILIKNQEVYELLNYRVVSIVADRGRPSILPRRVSMLSASSRPKPPPPIRRTSSVVGSSRTPFRQDTSNAAATAARPQKADDNPPTACGQPPSSAIRRTLSSTYADVIQTLNSQLSPSASAAPSSVAPSNVRRPYRRTLTATGCDEDGGRMLALSGTMPQANVGSNRNNVNHNNNNPSLMTQIQRGAVLRQSSVTSEKSAPRF
jgi:hypothetical protein